MLETPLRAVNPALQVQGLEFAVLGFSPRVSQSGDGPTLLGGSWAVKSGVISPLIWVKSL